MFAGDFGTRAAWRDAAQIVTPSLRVAVTHDGKSHASEKP
jgi:hypothetical protein